MSGLIEYRGRGAVTPIEAVDRQSIAACRRRLGAAARRWLDASGFEPSRGSAVLIPDDKNGLARVLVGVDPQQPLAALAGLPQQLPAGRYRLAEEGVALDPQLAALGWALGAYRFDRYRKSAAVPAQLVVSRADLNVLKPQIEAVGLVRDLVNTPTEDMGPEQIAQTIKEMARTHRARVKEWVGDALLKANFPTIHAVGRASHRPPRLVEMTWGKATDPKLVLIGKGVCFDTGGLDLKPSAGMRWMKKDMGGSAHAIALASLVMAAKLPVHLTLLVPTVENSVSGNALRPGDVVRTRAGHTVEIDNTDAEGRLILCDALAYAGEQEPDLLVDFATLTGAARVALGPDLPALFTNREPLASGVLEAAEATHDPMWRLPLWRPYHSMLSSYLADFANSGASRHAGAITAALYLERFVPEATPWMHVDVYAWNDSHRPGRPRGGEAQSLRAFFAFLQKRYSKAHRASKPRKRKD
ncbi:leucyl aminopeptidase family protein [Oleiagrimonas citrea]|uniref:Leucyl aminopeptidase family protein n=1 Tax=Oleiagrimonas citrea TaxID=1665687 RepID=A0A846ZLK5_9GAMM|nr:leucyl aminopeptidase family protein [Oleiagrimonas citrea]NKZ38438.1 leucyl aminopeptidase family protein [Oleiagrimonas citrea]